jgi:hypothetical protein
LCQFRKIESIGKQSFYESSEFSRRLHIKVVKAVRLDKYYQVVLKKKNVPVYSNKLTIFWDIKIFAPLEIIQ